jgi:hypothetical protein
MNLRILLSVACTVALTCCFAFKTWVDSGPAHAPVAQDDLSNESETAQKHPVEGWLKALIEKPSRVLDKFDARHWPERQAVLLCMQTTDTSIDLYWKDGMLRSRHGTGLPPSTHIPVVEAFADRLAKKMHGEQGRYGSRFSIDPVSVGDNLMSMVGPNLWRFVFMQKVVAQLLSRWLSIRQWRRRPLLTRRSSRGSRKG